MRVYVVFVFCFYSCCYKNLMSSMFVDKSWVFFSNYFSKTNYWNGPKIKGFELVEVLSVLMTKSFPRYQRLVLLGSLAFWPSPVNCGGKHVVTLCGT